MFNKLQLALHLCTFPSYSKDMAAEHWGSGTSVGERSLNPCFSIVRQQLTEIGGKMVILTGFGKPLAPKLFFPSLPCLSDAQSGVWHLLLAVPSIGVPWHPEVDDFKLYFRSGESRRND